MQAARGASLNASEPTRTRPVPAPRLLGLFAAVALAGYAVDVVTKVLAVDRLTRGETVPVLGDWFGLYLTRNPGAAFSTGTSYTVVLSLISIAAVCVVLYLVRRIGSAGWAVGLGLLLAGVSGNLTDRVLRSPGPLRGHVIDFLQLPNWPIFNVADICINLAAAVIVVQSLRGIAIDGHRDREAQDPDEAS
ncbi:signal peptidase II [Nocardioides donggukensis]|uniref:Lipoprotein signal peptidase n=1 Tax=Nocardioides donggukensis TaxID=2774019 RepID=A0A927K2P6_9ACTN|nr:signal peptidase II [Nocardioides donggukensis]MBD8869229.1 signal peptidase II [Nocardioides donggukensis]